MILALCWFLIVQCYQFKQSVFIENIEQAEKCHSRPLICSQILTCFVDQSKSYAAGTGNGKEWSTASCSQKFLSAEEVQHKNSCTSNWPGVATLSAFKYPTEYLPGFILCSPRVWEGRTLRNYLFLGSPSQHSCKPLIALKPRKVFKTQKGLLRFAATIRPFFSGPPLSLWFLLLVLHWFWNLFQPGAAF